MDRYSYELIRSKRKTVALVVGRDARLIVRAPFRFPLRNVDVFLREKREWIDGAMKRMRERQQVSAHSYEPGDQFWFLGEKYALRFSGTDRESVAFRDGACVVAERFRAHARERITAWYNRAAKNILVKRVRYFSEKHLFDVKSVTINRARTRWGSCSGEGRINFSFRLVMAPLSVIDSVVAHELAHLAHRNHSREFWKEVSRILPGFEKDRKWLRENGHMLIC